MRRMGLYRFGRRLNSRGLKLGLLALVFLFLVSVGIFASSKDIVLVVDDKQYNMRVFGQTVQDVLDAAGIELEQGDVVRPGKESTLYDGSLVVVARKKQVTIYDGETKIVTTMTVPSWAEILCAQGITLGKHDIVEADLNRDIGSDPSIRITRQDIVILTEREEIPYTVERKADKNLAPFETKVVQKGVKGIKENKVRVITKNGKEVKREIIETKIVREPQKEMIRYSPVVASRGDGDYRTVKQLTMNVTAYTNTGRRTAMGTWPTHGTAAVDPAVIPLGTPLYIEGYGFAVARDTGSSIKGNRLDVFFDTKKNALKWGKKTVQVRILRKIN